MAIPTAAQIPAVIQGELDIIDKERQEIIGMIPLVSVAEELIAKFKNLPGTSDWTILIGHGFNQLNGVLVKVEALDFRELVVVRRWIREQGFPAPKTEDYAEIRRRSWQYYQPGKPTFMLNAFVPYSSTKLEGQKCEYVQVGVKEKPVYELRCDGEKLEETNGGSKEKRG